MVNSEEISYTIHLFLSLAASGFNIYVNNQQNSIILEHGQGKQIDVKVVSNNDNLDYLCDLSCHYTVNGKQLTSFPILQQGSDTKTLSFPIVAPSKGKEGDSETYKVEVDCSQTAYLLCSGKELDSKSELLTVTYTLTTSERAAKNYVESVMPSITTGLTNADSDIKETQDTLGQLNSNVKVNDIPTKLNDLKSKYNNYKSEADKVKSLFENYEYLTAQSSLRTNLEGDISTLNNDVQKLKNDLDEIIKRHKEITEKLTKLSSKLSTLSDLMGKLQRESSDSVEGIQRLTKNFESGNFVSYNEVENGINKLTELADSEIKQMEQEILERIEKSLSMYSQEIKDLCEQGYCLENKLSPSSNFETVCQGYSLIKKNVQTKNNELTLNHENSVEKINENNKKINKLNDIIKNINLKIDEGVTIQTDNCKNSLTNIPESIDEAIKNCEISLEESPQIKETEKVGLFAKLLKFFKKLFSKQKSINLIENQEIPSLILLRLSEPFESFLTIQCMIKEINIQKTQISNLEVVNRNIEGESLGELQEGIEQCCVFGQCTPCCINDECKNDESTYPVIFVHGHSAFAWNSLDYSINAFKKFQDQLEKEGKFIDAGIILPETSISKVAAGDWGKIRMPISIRSSYYQGVYNENGATIGKQQDQHIDVYSQRLAGIVDKVLHHTNKDKVIIVAHSMGGIVSRNYIKNHGGDLKVHKLVTIGSPHHGIYGWLVGGLCGATHLGLPECQDMQAGNDFLTKNLNYGNEVLVPTLSIIGSCDEETDTSQGITFQHDEVVRDYSAKLDGAENFYVYGSCVSGSGTFHQELVGNSEVYTKLVGFIG